MPSVYRVYSHHVSNDRERFAIDTWDRDGITNLPIRDSDLERSIDNLPFLKDLLDIASDRCSEDSDIIIYTNTDICLVSDGIKIPSDCPFFSVRKEIQDIKYQSSKDLESISYEHSINCDTFGFTKKWYLQNRDIIPDFVIGSPKWDIAFLLLLDNAIRIDNVTYHIKHNSAWKSDLLRESNVYNNFLFDRFVENFNFNSVVSNKESFFRYMSTSRGFAYMTNPIFICFRTPSHNRMYEEFFLTSFKKIYKDEYVLVSHDLETQVCETGNYHTKGWRRTQIKKFESLISTVSKLIDNQIFIFCDVDILHVSDCINDIQKYLETNELVAQNAYSKHELLGKYCSGFFAGKKTKQVLAFLQKILNDLKANINDENNGDQFYLNCNSYMLKIKTLDETYFNPGYITEGFALNPNEFESCVYQLPDKTKIVHANFIVSPENKLNFLRLASTRCNTPVDSNNPVNFNNHYHLLVEYLHCLFLRCKGLQQRFVIVLTKNSVLQKYIKFAELPITIIETEYKNAPVFDNSKSKDLTKEYIDLLQHIAQKNNPDNINNRKIVIDRRTNRQIDPSILVLLQNKGYEKYYLEDLILDEQAKIFNSASHIVCAHGSALANILFCRSGTKVIELNPGYNIMCFSNLARRMYEVSGINLIHYTLFEDNVFTKNAKEIYLDSNINIYHLNKKILRTDINKYFVVEDETQYQNKENKNISILKTNIEILEKII